MGLALWRFATGQARAFSKTMKFSLLVSAASEHRLAVGMWISNVDGGAQQRSADVITSATPKMAALVGPLQRQRRGGRPATLSWVHSSVPGSMGSPEL
jgi:hypothetical protein